MMKQQIIACVDGSNSTPAVCQWAAWAATQLQAPLTLLHVLTQPTTVTTADWSGSIGLGSQEALLAQLVELDLQRNKLAQEQGKHLLQAARHIIQTHQTTGHELVIKSSQRHGELPDALQALEADTRLVILGRQGEQQASSYRQVGSELESVIRVLHTPILMALPAFKTPTRVMFAYDGSSAGRSALNRLTISPLLQGLHCDLVMVDGEPLQLEEAKALLQAAGVQVTPYALTGDVETALLRHIAAEHIDLVIMGAYGHSRLRQFLLGSHTSRMLSQSPVPLLLLR